MAHPSKKNKTQATKRTSPSVQKLPQKSPRKLNYTLIFVVIGLLLLTYISFYPSLKNGFTNWDDPGYVTENENITHLNAPAVKNMFSHFMMSNYHPLTMLSLAMDYQAVKLDPARYHLVNVLLHLLNTLLVFLFIYKLSDKKILVAAIVALLFGIHPMHVESVSWVSSRKDVLFALFFLGGLVTYLNYVKSNKLKLLFYALTLILFVLSALSKPAAVTFPVVLLLIDYYQKRKFDWKSIAEKVPFFLIAIVFGILSIRAQSDASAISTWSVMGLPYRFLFASYGFMAYLFKFLIPIHLSAVYPYPVTFPITETLPIIFYITPALVLGIGFLLYKSLRISRLYVFGFLFYLVNVVLVLQFVSVGAVLMADRYAYLPYIGLAFIVAMELQRFYQSKSLNPAILKPLKMCVSAILVCAAVVFAVATFQRTKVWRNNERLWTDVINKYPLKAETAYLNRGNYYAREANQYEKAMQDYNTFISINTHNASVFSNRGNLFGLMKQYDKSLEDYQRALAIDSNFSDALVNSGTTYMTMRQYERALTFINRAIRINPNKLLSFQNRGFCNMSLGRNQEALKDLDYMISRMPDDFLNYFYRGITYYNSQKYQEALADFSKTIALNPSHGEAYSNRAQTYNKLGDFKNALNDALKAQSLKQAVNPDFINSLKAKQ